MAKASAPPQTLATCKICLLEDVLQPDDKNLLSDRLISPCACNGTLKWVHRHCLARWRFENQGSDAMYTCEICKTRYSIRTQTPTFLSYIWHQWSPVEKCTYLLEFFALIISFSVGAKSFINDVQPELERFPMWSPLFQPTPFNTTLVLPSIPKLPLLSLLLPKPLLRLMRRLILWVFVFNHCFLYGHPSPSKASAYMCILLTFLPHIGLYLKWSQENSIELLCNKSDLEEENVLQRSIITIR